MNNARVRLPHAPLMCIARVRQRASCKTHSRGAPRLVPMRPRPYQHRGGIAPPLSPCSAFTLHSFTHTSNPSHPPEQQPAPRPIERPRGEGAMSPVVHTGSIGAPFVALVGAAVRLVSRCLAALSICKIHAAVSAIKLPSLPRRHQWAVSTLTPQRPRRCRRRPLLSPPLPSSTPSSAQPPSPST